MSRLDYSKWDHIEISDDEDDTHPNVDTPSLFRWRHQARVDRMEESQREKETLQREKLENQQKLAAMKQKLKDVEANSAAEDLAKLKLEYAELEKQETEWRRKEEEFVKKEKLTPLNIDTLCKDGKSKTIINKYSDSKKKDNMTDDERMEMQDNFTKKNEPLLKKFGMLRKYEDSQSFLEGNPHLTCEETANYLVLWCINLEVQEKHDLMSHVAHQTIVMQFILELARTLERDPRSCVRAFFTRIQMGDVEKQYMDAFNDELSSFKDRIRARAKARLEEAMKEVEEEERQKRLGPGGLDPVEVFDSLPSKLQECFEKKDIPLLQETLLAMPKEDAEKYLKQCIDSGLWVPNAADLQQDEPAATGSKD